MNYAPFLKWHAECEGTAGLIDSIGALDFVEINVVGEVSDGIVGPARDLADPLDAFNRSAVGSGPFDFRSQAVDKMTFSAWYRANSVPASQVYFEQTGTTENEKAMALRSVHDFGGGLKGVVLFLRDNGGAAWRGFGAPAAGLATYPTAEWCYIGFSVSISDDRVTVWLYTQSEGQHIVTTTGLAALGLPFNYTTLGVTWFGPNASGGSIGTTGMLGDADQIDMFHDIEFRTKDVNFFWNKGRGRRWPQGYKTPAIGGPHYYAE